MNAAPQPHPAPRECPVCGGPIAPADARCLDCNYDLAGIGDRPGVFSRATMWWTVVGFAVVYAIVLAVVAATR